MYSAFRNDLTGIDSKPFPHSLDINAVHSSIRHSLYSYLGTLIPKNLQTVDFAHVFCVPHQIIINRYWT